MDIKKISIVALAQLKKSIFSSRFITILLVVMPFLFTQIRPIVSMADSTGFPCSPYLYPFLFSEIFGRFFICSGILILLCDAPFMDNNQPYIILRSGKRNWFWGISLYISLVSAVYIAFLNIVCILSITPQLSIDSGWGKIISTLAASNAGSVFGVGVYFNRFITMNYNPFQAMLLSMLVSWLVFVFMGMLLFYINSIFNRVVGVTLVGVFIVLSAFVQEAFNNVLFYFSPISWLSIDQISINGSTRRPSPVFCVSVLVVLIVLLHIATYFTIRNGSINFESEKNEV